MTSRPVTTHEGKLFELPMTAVFSITKSGSRMVAHALEFDLVCVAETEDEAVRKLRVAVQAHVEYGLKNRFDRDILQSAPEKAWNALTPETTLSIGEPIIIREHDSSEKRLIRTFQHEDRPSLTAA